jgi:hypothetical protein
VVSASPSAAHPECGSRPTNGRRPTAFTSPGRRSSRCLSSPESCFRDLILLIGPQYGLAERINTRRVLQALVYIPLLFVTMSVLSLPIDIYQQHVIAPMRDVGAELDVVGRRLG